MDGIRFGAGVGLAAPIGSHAAGHGGVSRAPAALARSRARAPDAQPRLGPDLDALSDWLVGLRDLGIRQAAPALVMALERLRRATLAPEVRVALLQRFKPVVLKTCRALPKPWLPGGLGCLPGAGGCPSAPGRGATIEQRLYRLMFQALHQALLELDTAHPVPGEASGRQRRWVLRNLLRFCGRQLRYAALWSCPLPRDTWRDLHALHIYLTLRRATWSADALVERCRGADPTREYKALLLFGLIAEQAPGALRRSAVTAGLAGWAAQTILDDTRGLAGETGLLVVDVATDTPPRRCATPLRADCRGWVLIPPRAFLQQLRATGTAAAVPPAVRFRQPSPVDRTA